MSPVANPGRVNAEDVAARPVQPVHRLGGDDQRVRRVQAAGDPDDDLGLADRAEPLLEPGDLDVVGLVAVQREPLDVVGHEREPVDLAAQADVARGRVEGEVDVAGIGRCVSARAVVVERALPHPLLPDPVEVDVGDRAARAVGEALGLGRAARRTRRSSSARPRTGRSSTRPAPAAA